MRVGFIGDVVGRPGRKLIQTHVRALKEEHALDCVIANTENASHGFGLSIKHAHELFQAGVDMMSGGNHTWDKKEIIPLLETHPILRPVNYPKGVPGRGVGYVRSKDYTLAVVNLMGHFTMPMCDNPFISILETLETLEPHDGVLIDFHAEVTSEKRALFALLKGKVSAIIGTHTHVGTDDLTLDQGSAYLSDIGLTGCRDNVIGMDEAAPLKRFLTGLPASFEIPNRCKGILQMVVMEFSGMKCQEAFKIKLYDGTPIITQAWHET
ncbi:MAG: YmdB family metallophosphoesterase [Campylobacterales bacterium]|nr:YmdB family metallophosphoesterase [Campylobacterales bacterium]